MQVNDKLLAGVSGHQMNNGLSLPSSAMLANGQGLHAKPNNDNFNLALKDIKKEPGESMPCSKHLDCQMSSGNMYPGRYEDDFVDHMMDADLQELFNELNDMPVPPMSDLELQNMINITIKQDEPFNIDLGQQNQRSSPKPSLPVQKIVIKTEYSPGSNQASAGSPQMRPSSAGPAFSIASAAMSTPSLTVTSVPLSQAQSSCSNRVLPTWQEISHAQQLKQIAANRQQHALIQLQQQHQQNQASNWSTLSSSGPSPGSFNQEKVPSPSIRQQQFSPHTSQIPGMPNNGIQSKGMNNYFYKPNSTPQNNHMDMMMQQKNQDLNFINNPHAAGEPHHSSTKSLFHFSPEQTNQQVPSVLSSQSKPSIVHYTQQQQASATTQEQQHPTKAQSLLRPPNVAMSLQQKLILQKMLQNHHDQGLQYSVLQHRQDQHSAVGQGAGPSPGPNACPAPNSGSGFLSSSQQSHVIMEKKQTLQRQMMEQKQQLLLQQQLLADVDKITPQDQLNRHLTRPPPDYKDQRRNIATIQQTSQYSDGSFGLNQNASQPLSSPVSSSNMMSQTSDLLSTSHASRMSSLPGARNMGVYSNISCNQPSLYTVNSGVTQIQQHTTQTQIGPSPTNSMTSRQAALSQGNGLASYGSGYGVSQQVKQGMDHGATNMPGQRGVSVMINSSATQQTWASQEAAAKHNTLKAPGSPFCASTPYANQPLQPSIGNQHFPQRAMAPPNQMAPGVQMKPVNQMSSALSGQALGSLRAELLRPNQLRPHALSNMNQPGPGVNTPSTEPSSSLTTTNQTSRGYSGNDNGNDMGFDFLNQQNDSLGSALNNHADFIDSLLKTGPGNDDWMKDINLDEILGNPS